jgi:hypothetical protein
MLINDTKKGCIKTFRIWCTLETQLVNTLVNTFLHKVNTLHTTTHTLHYNIMYIIREGLQACVYSIKCAKCSPTPVKVFTKPCTKYALKCSLNLI